MKRSKFTEEQIAYALRQVESGTAPADVCRQLGVAEAVAPGTSGSPIITDDGCAVGIVSCGDDLNPVLANTLPGCPLCQ